MKLRPFTLLILVCILGLTIVGCQSDLPNSPETASPTTTAANMSFPTETLRGPTAASSPPPLPLPISETPISMVSKGGFTLTLHEYTSSQKQFAATLCAQYSRILDADWNPVAGIRVNHRILTSKPDSLFHRQFKNNGTSVEHCWQITFSDVPQDAEIAELWVDYLVDLPPQNRRQQITLERCRLAQDKMRIGTQIRYKCAKDPETKNGVSIEITGLPDQYLTQEQAERFVQYHLVGADVIRGPWVFDLPTPTPTATLKDDSSATVVGRVIKGYGDHQPVSGLPLWIGAESNGVPDARTDENGEFILSGLPIGERVEVVNSHLSFHIPESQKGTTDIGTLKYPLIHPPVYYWHTPEPLLSISTLLSQGISIPFTLCQSDPSWQRPTEQAQRERVWEKPPFRLRDTQYLRQWFQQSAVVYNTIDIFTQSFPEGPALDEPGKDWGYLLGLWTSDKFSLSGSDCSYNPKALRGLFDRATIEVWLLNYQVKNIKRFGEHYAIEVENAPGYQIVRFPGNERVISVILTTNGQKIGQAAINPLVNQGNHKD